MKFRFLLLCVAVLVALPSHSKLKINSSFPNLKLPVIAKSKDRAVAAIGSTLSIKQLKGKVVLVDFWAHWCEPCKIALPAYDKIYNKYKSKGLVVVGINVDEEKHLGLSFLKEHPVKFPILFDEGQNLAKKAEVATMPTSFLIGKDGKIKHIHEGFREGDSESVEKLLKKLLKNDKTL